MNGPRYYLEFNGISKTFPGVQALDQIRLGLREGRVHGLVGENGAGKSTLLKILSGAYRPTAGRLIINGRECDFRSAADGLAAGVAMIYQELYLVPEMTVAENIFLGHLPQRLLILNQHELLARAKEVLVRLGEEIDPAAKIKDLSLARRQMVEIAKALSRGAKIIAFDEPTSSLASGETERLFAVIRNLRESGCVILYISHRLDEIFALCDEVTVLRDGRLIETFEDLGEVSPDRLINRMVGRDIKDIYGYHPREIGGPALEAQGLWGPGPAAPASFSVAKGEIVGLFGLIGAGRSELLKLLYGAAPRAAGEIKIDGRTVLINSPEAAIAHGLIFCPEDRKREGLVPVRSVQENLNLGARRDHLRLGFIITPAWEKANAIGQAQKLGIRTPSLDQLIINLSGGNQQKVILGRGLAAKVKVMLLDEPTRGIDVGAKREIYSIIYEMAGQGIGVMFASSDLAEVLGISDRVLVMRQGQISAVFSRAEAAEEKIMKHALPESVMAKSA